MPLLGIAVTNSARSLGHIVSFAITGTMMLGIFIYTYRSSSRRWGTHWQKYGPSYLTALAGLFVMADLTRHVFQDQNIWPEATLFDGWKTASQINASGYSNFDQVNALNMVNLFDKDSHVLEFKSYNPDAWIEFDSLNGMKFSEVQVYGGNGTRWQVFCSDDANGPWLHVKNTSTLSAGWTEVDQDPVGAHEGAHRYWRWEMISATEGITATFGFFEFYYRGKFSSQQYKWGCHQEVFRCLAWQGWLFTVAFTYCGFALLMVGSLWNAHIVDKLSELHGTWTELRNKQVINKAPGTRVSVVNTPISMSRG